MYGGYGVHVRAKPIPIERQARSAARSVLYWMLADHYLTLDDAIEAAIYERKEHGMAALTVTQVKAAVADILNDRPGPGTDQLIEADQLIAKAWRASGKKF